MKFPQIIHVVVEPGKPVSLRLCEGGLSDDLIEPGQNIAIYRREKIVVLKQRRWTE